MVPAFFQHNTTIIVILAITAFGLPTIALATVIGPLDGAQQYCIVFYTDSTITGLSGAYSDYQNFSVSQAQQNVYLNSLSDQWYPLLASTADGDGIGQPSTVLPLRLLPVFRPPYPVYNTKGERVANSLYQLYSGFSYNGPLIYDQFAGPMPNNQGTWDVDATVWLANVGTLQPSVRQLNDGGIFQSFVPADPSYARRLYVISDVINVPEPATSVLLALGGLAIVIYQLRSRWRRY